MVAVRPLHQGWKDALASLVRGAQRELVIVAPFITADGTRLVSDHLSPRAKSEGRVEMITDLSPAHVCDGSLDADAIVGLAESHPRCSVWHVPCLHAKVYIADESRAIVTSGNLTGGAFHRNAEYGVEINDPALASSIRSHMADFQEIGARVALDAMRKYAGVARTVRDAYSRQRAKIDPATRRAFNAAVDSAETELIRLRLAGGAMHTVFARTIEVLLARHGPLPTTSIHELVRQLHPDLCDDGVDRVIDGKHFGKKWKHAVRTAQQQLKRRGVVRNEGALWSLDH